MLVTPRRPLGSGASGSEPWFCSKCEDTFRPFSLVMSIVIVYWVSDPFCIPFSFRSEMEHNAMDKEYDTPFLDEGSGCTSDIVPSRKDISEPDLDLML